MYKVLRPDRDAYITNRVIKGERSYSANVGAAGSLDLFKLYGNTLSGSVPNIELSRLLVHYDLQPLRDLVTAKRIDPGNPSFSCTLKLFDVFGGQPTPAGFTVVVHPLSRSFEEGLGRDVVYYADRDVCNFLTGSEAQGPWLLSGCALGGGLPGSVDYITASTAVAGGASLRGSQLFTTGEENLEIDITLAVSATLAGFLPDEGFRVALDPSHEADLKTYFVKRFASRTAYNEDKHPRLIVKFDDSIQDDSQALFLDSPSYLFLFNYVRRAPANLTSGSALTPITGSNSLILKLATEVSGGWYTLAFTGSQHTRGIFPVDGVYSASVNLSSTDAVLATKLAQSGSIKLIPIWGSLDSTVTYLTGSAITAYAAERGPSTTNKRFVVTISGLRDSHFTNEETVLRVHLFDITAPIVKASRLPVELPGSVVRDVHWQVRDEVTGLIEIPFDTAKNSTRLSSDASGMYFKLDMSNLTRDRSYVIDILIVTGDNRQVYKSASPVFRVSDLR
jgi:hypothetical protein